jgi:hypothetical protein
MLITQKELSSTLFQRKMNRKDIVHTHSPVFSKKMHRIKIDLIDPVKKMRESPCIDRLLQKV